ncbi:MAG: RNA-splicing factor [Peltula sp. TS41687]|nr:MAG: RNA-splicing factor [Peltula sp. TS41687]
MSSNVGLSTPRGSGTSGYVQRNLSALKPRNDHRAAPYPQDFDSIKHQHRARKPDEGILEHDRQRSIEVKVFELRDRLEDEGVDEEEIEAQTSALREKLLKDGGGGGTGQGAGGKKQQFKPHQVHELAKAKIEESERLRRALGISEDYEEGSHWKRGEEGRNASRRADGGEGGKRDV